MDEKVEKCLAVLITRPYIVVERGGEVVVWMGVFL
jgi:hypothetical protein